MIDADGESSYTPAPWEKMVGYGAAVLVLLLVVYLVVRNEPFADSNLVVFTRIVLSLAVAALGATVPGFLHVDWSTKGVAIRAGGALALFVLSFLFTPEVGSEPPPAPPPAADREDVEVVVGLATENPGPPSDGLLSDEDQYGVTYRDDGGGDSLSITFASDYFDEVEAGRRVKPVGLLGEGPYFSLPQVGIDVKVTNNSDLPVFLHEAVIKVESSRLDPTPLLVLTHNDGNVGEIEFTNDGWSEPEDMALSVRLVNRQTETQTRPFALPLTDVQPPVYRFSMLPILGAYCSDLEAIQDARDFNDRGLHREGAGAWARFRDSCAGLKPFDLSHGGEDLSPHHQSLVVYAEGSLSFEGRSAEGRRVRQTVAFAVDVYVTPPDGLGAPGFGPTGEYTLELDTDGADYTVTHSISQPLKPKDVDRFVLWVGAEKSSAHVLTVVLRYGEGGEVRSRPVRLDYLMPRANRAVLNMGDPEF